MMPESFNVASHLARMAAEQPARVALQFPRNGVRTSGNSEHYPITFGQLNADVDAIAHGLVSVGITQGARTVLMVPPSPEFFAITFALFKVAAVPVLIDPGMGIRNLGRCLAEAEPQAFIGIAKANVARRILGWGRKTIRTTVNVPRWRMFCTTSLARLRKVGQTRGPYPTPDVQRDEAAAILFTSGSTGIAKGAEYTHGNFASQLEILRATYGIAPGEVDLCTFPLFALFGPALGMTCVIPEMDFTRPAKIDPRKAAAQIKQFGVTNMFGSPAVIRRMGELLVPALTMLHRKVDDSPTWEAVTTLHPREDIKQGLRSLKRVISAGAPASAASIERFVKLLPESAEVFTPYGATEALPVSNIGSREILGETRKLTEQGKGVCIGRTVVGVEVHVIRITDEPIPEWSDSLTCAPGEVGEFVVSGPVVTRQYYNRAVATTLAKIRHPKTGEVLHRMGDVGYLDEHGRLWFCGRKSHRVMTPNGTLFTDMIEPVFNTIPGVRRTALVGVARGVTYPVVCVEREPRLLPLVGAGLPASAEWFDIQKALCELAPRFSHTREIGTYLLYPGTFPVDVRHNSKIFREKLAVWADRQLGKKWNPGAGRTKPAVSGLGSGA
jgi:acyl-CoA synthetase (AMP-forming)/AMP-acid ligase II